MNASIATLQNRLLGLTKYADVLLAVVHLDPRETQVHAALCVDGGWSWLR